MLSFFLLTFTATRHIIYIFLLLLTFSPLSTSYLYDHTFSSPIQSVNFMMAEIGPLLVSSVFFSLKQCPTNSRHSVNICLIDKGMNSFLFQSLTVSSILGSQLFNAGRGPADNHEMP
jgi:hypothetical protein